MTLDIANETDGVVHVALYKKSSLRPAEPAVAWVILSPPPRGRAIFSIPRDYQVFARYSFSPEDPWQPVYQTNALSLQLNRDSFAIREVNLGRSALGATLARNVKKAEWGELRIENHFMVGVWCHVQLGKRDVQLPHLLPPRGVMIEALDPSFYLALTSPLIRPGSSLTEEEIRATEVEIESGKGGTFTVRETPCQGCRIIRGVPSSAERIMQPKDIVVQSPRKPKKLSRKAEEKPKTQSRPKAAIKKREVAMKPVNLQHNRGKPKKPSDAPSTSVAEPQASE